MLPVFAGLIGDERRLRCPGGCTEFHPNEVDFVVRSR